MEIENPISEKARGILYVVGIVVSGSAVTAGAVYTALNQPLIAAIIGIVGSGFGTIVSTLARSNLGSPIITSYTLETAVPDPDYVEAYDVFGEGGVDGGEAQAR